MVMRPIIGGTLPQRRIRTPGKGLQGEVVGFCRALRRAGLKITSGRIIDLFRSFDVLDITDLQNLYIAGKSNLVSSQEEQALYDAIFRQYWFDERANRSEADDSVEMEAPFGDEGEEGSAQEGGKPSDEGDKEGEGKDKPGLPSDEETDAGAEPGEPSEEEEGIPSYSPAEVLAQKDFSTFEADQVAELRRIIAKLVPKLATKISRRKRPDMRAQEVDLRRSVKKSIRTGAR